jgi:hypothetical protein
MISPTTYFFVRKEEKEDVSEKKRLKRGILKEKRKRRKKRRSGMPGGTWFSTFVPTLIHSGKIRLVQNPHSIWPL